MTNVEPFIRPGRLLPSWIAGFTQFTERMQSPFLHRKWAAISAVAGALERKVWIRSQGEEVYPNLYIFLVGPAGAGKTRPLMTCWRLWNALESHNVAEISLTKAALVDNLKEKYRKVAIKIDDKWEEHTFNSLLVAAPELGALIPGYDSEFMNTLTHLFDGHIYSEKRRQQKDGPLIIERPIVNLIACTTPGYLVDALPASAWIQGFMSRVIIAYANVTEIKPFDFFDESSAPDKELEEALKHDIRKIGEYSGRLRFTRPAAQLAEELNKKEFDPKPAHPRLINYNTRRPLQFLKLCMVAAVDRGVDVIDSYDVATAKDWMIEVEASMGDVFNAMTSGGDAQIIQECLHYINIANVKNNHNGVPPHLVYQFLHERAPSTHVERIYTVMLNSKMFTLHSIQGGHIVKPKLG